MTVVLTSTVWTQHVVFRLSHEWYALPVEYVRAVERWRVPTPVPGTPSSVIGIINQRGSLVTVIDVRVLINLPLDPPSRSTRLVFAEHDGVDMCLVTDHVADMLSLDEASFEPAPPRASMLIEGLVRTPYGVASLLDLGQLLNAVRVTYS